MSDQNRTYRQQVLREAEGYLDLVTVFSDRWSLSGPVRDRLAERAYETLSKINSTGLWSGRVFYLRGQALMTMERFEDAITPLESAAELDPSNTHVWLALGWCFKRIKRLDLAIQSLEEALGVDPDLAIVHYNLACYWSLAKNAKLAVRYLATAFDIEPDYRDLVGDERDFDPIRGHAEFLALTTVIV